MAALFSPRADRWLRATLLAGALLVLGTPTLLMAWVRTPQVTGQFDPVEQPVLFDHRHHVLDAAIDCRFCHETAERSRYASVPATQLCMGCHGQIWNQSEQLAAVRKSYFEHEPIRWNRVHRLPDFVYFDHSAHLAAGVGCVTCHGRVDHMAQVEQVAPLTMGWCIDCHRNPEPRLRPHALIASMEAVPPEAAERAAREHPVRHLTHCTTCHR